MAKHVYDVNFNSCSASDRRKCHLMAQANMTFTARNICTCAVFFLNFGLPTYFVSHYCWGRALYAVFYGRVLTRAEPFDCGVANVVLKITHIMFAWFPLLS